MHHSTVLRKEASGRPSFSSNVNREPDEIYDVPVRYSEYMIPGYGKGVNDTVREYMIR
jgi:hypothetical protein